MIRIIQQASACTPYWISPGGRQTSSSPQRLHARQGNFNKRVTGGLQKRGPVPSSRVGGRFFPADCAATDGLIPNTWQTGQSPGLLK